ncbi:hypothetical protein [Nocardia donostiensis]|uniref:hypothetical protein n=1 Tax=Nocardia donostiensis TaxID=1538463 RepID=UPI00111586B3|nr:hypothetical protein [Nocardia donostiensis]
MAVSNPQLITSTHLGDALQAAGDHSGAFGVWTRVFDVLEPLAYPDAVEIEIQAHRLPAVPVADRSISLDLEGG